MKRMNAKHPKHLKKTIHAKRALPGFSLTLGITVAMLSLLVLIPLASVLAYSFQMPAGEFLDLLAQPNVRQAFFTSISCSFLAAAVNCVFGLNLAWILTRYEFPGRKLMDAMIELPLALPTSVAGITLSKMYSGQGAPGRLLEQIGIRASYSKTGIVIAMIFIGIPFVVRSLQPVLKTLPKSLEEAGELSGASRFYIFRRILLPELSPALLSGFGLALARGIGEYGSVIYISGNSAKQGTQVVSYLIMQKLNSGRADYEGAAALALVLLTLSFALLLVISIVQAAAGRRTRQS